MKCSISRRRSSTTTCTPAIAPCGKLSATREGRPLGALLSVLLNAWLNRRMFVYDALSEHASAAELAWARREGGWPLFAMSALLGLLYLVPLVNFLAPIYMGLAFTHYGLDALRRQRGGAGA